MNRIRQIIATVLAITFMVMTLIPCADACDNDSHQTDLTIEKAQEHHEQHKDVCSPLCSCSCCSTQITVIHFPTIAFISPITVQRFSVFKDPFVSSFYSSIWQPPKIS